MDIGGLQQGAVGLIVLAIISAITRVVLVYLSLRGAPPETRPTILKSLAVVFQSFGIGRFQNALRPPGKTSDATVDEPAPGKADRRVETSDPP
nr:hypothetical protein [Kibdelosporangium sp. MJ126-NF4]